MTPGLAVLVVEDDLPTQHLLSTVVQRHQLTPVCTGDGENAIRLIAKGQYGAILLDLLLPEVNGFEVLRHIACVHPGLLGRVIVMTAAAEPVWRDCQYLDRIYTVVRKPFDVDVLEGAILACCERDGNGR